MCSLERLGVFQGEKMKTVLFPDASLGLGTTQLNLLDTQKSVLCRQQERHSGKSSPAPAHQPWGVSLWNLCALTVAQQEQRDCQTEAPSPRQGQSLPHTHGCHKGLKSPAIRPDVSAEGTDAIPQEEVSESKVSKDQPILHLTRTQGASAPM